MCNPDTQSCSSDGFETELYLSEQTNMSEALLWMLPDTLCWYLSRVYDIQRVLTLMWHCSVLRSNWQLVLEKSLSSSASIWDQPSVMVRNDENNHQVAIRPRRVPWCEHSANRTVFNVVRGCMVLWDVAFGACTKTADHETVLYGVNTDINPCCDGPANCVRHPLGDSVCCIEPHLPQVTKLAKQLPALLRTKEQFHFESTKVCWWPFLIVLTKIYVGGHPRGWWV